jgi:hypothetical protein
MRSLGYLLIRWEEHQFHRKLVKEFPLAVIKLPESITSSKRCIGFGILYLKEREKYFFCLSFLWGR